MNYTNTQIESMYLDWFNNFLSCDAWRSHYHLSMAEGENILDLGRQMQDNKLIAEFIGLHDEILSTGNIHSWSDAPFFYITEDSKEKVMEGIAKYSKYHTEWNWLMPVVQECLTRGADEHEWDAIYNAVGTIDMEAIYQAVVEFIKTYNDER